MTKICSTCKLEKPIEKFDKSSRTKDGFRCECKDCRKEYRINNKEKIAKERKNHAERNKEKISLQAKEKYQRDKERIKKKTNDYYHKNKPAVQKRSNEYRLRNRDKILADKRQYQKRISEERKNAKLEIEAKLITVKFPDNYKICLTCQTLKEIDEMVNGHNLCKPCQSKQNKQYRLDHLDELRQIGRERYAANIHIIRKRNRDAKKTDEYRAKQKTPENRITKAAHQYIKTSLGKEGLKKNGKATMLYVNCSKQFFRTHLEAQFTKFMNWDNYGNKSTNWVMDHFIPREAFNIANQDEQDICFHWSNIQPLLWKDNAAKQDRMPDGTLARDSKNLFSLFDKKKMIYDHLVSLNLPHVTEEILNKFF